MIEQDANPNQYLLNTTNPDLISMFIDGYVKDGIALLSSVFTIQMPMESLNSTLAQYSLVRMRTEGSIKNLTILIEPGSTLCCLPTQFERTSWIRTVHKKAMT